MFKCRSANNRKNVIGLHVRKLRKQLRISQRELADRLFVLGLDIDKNAVQRIEQGLRFVTDIEVVYFAKIFSVTPEDLLKT